MLEFVPFPAHPADSRPRRLARAQGRSDTPLQARVKHECAELYPALDPRMWYKVVLNGEYRDDLAGFWIQVDDWVTYVLAKHFDIQGRPELH